MKLFEWVRDETYLIPYSGQLRGPAGVLMDRVGNSLDRALLLHALLRAAGQNVRLAKGTLTDEQGRSVLEKARPVPQDGIPSLARSSLQHPPQRVPPGDEQLSGDLTAGRRAIDEVTAAQRRVMHDVQARVARQTAMLATAIGARDLSTNRNQRRIEAVRDHWWVEWWTGGGWRTLDPTLPGAAAGSSLVEAKTTRSPRRSVTTRPINFTGFSCG